jgi:hypothetical protein
LCTLRLETNSQVGTTLSSKQTSKAIIPFRQDRHFIGRKDILQRLENIFEEVQYHKRAALVGLGGVG